MDPGLRQSALRQVGDFIFICFAKAAWTVGLLEPSEGGDGVGDEFDDGDDDTILCTGEAVVKVGVEVDG